MFLVSSTKHSTNSRDYLPFRLNSANQSKHVKSSWHSIIQQQSAILPINVNVDTSHLNLTLSNKLSCKLKCKISLLFVANSANLTPVISDKEPFQGNYCKSLNHSILSWCIYELFIINISKVDQE